MSFLNDQNINLRAVESEDLDFLLNMENDTLEWIQSENYQPFSRGVMKRYATGEHSLTAYGQYRFVIERAKDKVVIGAVDLFDYQSIHSRAGVGIYVLPTFRGKGIARRSLELLIEYARQVLNIELLFCSILETNENSIQLFQNAGFEKTGLRRAWAKIGGKRISVLLFQKEL